MSTISSCGLLLGNSLFLKLAYFPSKLCVWSKYLFYETKFTRGNYQPLVPLQKHPIVSYVVPLRKLTQRPYKTQLSTSDSLIRIKRVYPLVCTSEIAFRLKTTANYGTEKQQAGA